jgi:hypothetical protein
LLKPILSYMLNCSRVPFCRTSRTLTGASPCLSCYKAVQSRVWRIQFICQFLVEMYVYKIVMHNYTYDPQLE